MKTATANLENDHVHILRLIDVMEQVTKKPEANIEHLEKIVELIRNFADGLHHNKEEKLLFPQMVEKGFSFQQGPIAVMMQDHAQGRNFVKDMADNIALYKAGNTAVIPVIYSKMHGYIVLLRAHISKENNVLFQMADKVLSEEVQQSLLIEFKTMESKPVGSGSLADCIRQIESLAKAYNIQ